MPKKIVEVECPRCKKSDLTEQRDIGNKIGAGAVAGAAAGSIVPGLGTAAGAFVGAAWGMLGAKAIEDRYKCGYCEYTWGTHLE